MRKLMLLALWAVTAVSWAQDAPNAASATEPADDQNAAELLAPIPHWEMPPTQMVRAEAAYTGQRPEGAKYVATFELVVPGRRDQRRLSDTRSVAHEILSAPGVGRLSEAQRAAFGEDWLGFNRSRSGEPTTWRVYAVTEEDAERLASMLVDMLLADGREELSRAEEKAKGLQVKYGALQDRMKAAQGEVQKLGDMVNQMSRSTGLMSKDATLDAQTEVGRALRQVAVEAAGIEGKKEAIDAARGRPGLDDMSKSMLDRMMIEQDIELAGLLARKRILEKQQHETLTLRELWENWDSQRAILSRIESDLGNTRQWLQKAIESVRGITQHMDLKDNTLTIWPMGPEAPQ